MFRLESADVMVELVVSIPTPLRAHGGPSSRRRCGREIPGEDTDYPGSGNARHWEFLGTVGETRKTTMNPSKDTSLVLHHLGRCRANRWGSSLGLPDDCRWVE